MAVGSRWGRKAFGAVALAGSLLVLAGCATPFRAQVQHYQALPPLQGQTFHISPADSERSGSLEFQTYAQVVAQRLQQAGLRPADSAGAAQLLVELDYGAGPARERLATSPGSVRFGYGWGGSWYARHRWAWGYPGWGGFYDPWWGQPEVYSYAVYPAFLEMKIVRASDKASVYEGRAETTTRANDLTRTVPQLADALFQNFPGERIMSGTVKVPAKK